MWGLKKEGPAEWAGPSFHFDGASGALKTTRRSERWPSAAVGRATVLLLLGLVLI